MYLIFSHVMIYYNQYLLVVLLKAIFQK